METHRLLAELRSKQQKSLADIATPAGISRVAVMRAEKPEHHLVRGPTLDAILRDGYGLSADHPTYKKIVAAWTRDRLHPLKKPADELAAKVKNLTPEKRRALEKFLKRL